LGNLAYGYDSNGQRISKSGTFATDTLPSPSTATIDLNGRKTSNNGQPLSYDANGDLTSDGVDAYSWNARDQLTQISAGSQSQMSYAYDALGRRISKTVQNNTPVQYLYDGANAVQEMQGANVNPILSGLNIDERFARNDVTGRTYFLTDALNSTIALTDTTGAIVQKYSYDPYGNVTQSDTSTGFTNPYQYTGREADTPWLYYYRARYYSPVIGSFISEDPLGFGGGQSSFYAYAGGDSVNNIDPTGLQLGAGAIPAGAAIVITGCAISSACSHALQNAVQSASNAISDVCSSKTPCPPCKTVSGQVVPLGTIAHRPLDTPNTPEHGIVGPHYNIYKANQNPNNCQCFWQSIGAVSPTGLPAGSIPIEPFAN